MCLCVMTFMVRLRLRLVLGTTMLSLSPVHYRNSSNSRFIHSWQAGLEALVSGCQDVTANNVKRRRTLQMQFTHCRGCRDVPMHFTYGYLRSIFTPCSSAAGSGQHPSSCFCKKLKLVLAAGTTGYFKFLVLQSRQ